MTSIPYKTRRRDKTREKDKTRQENRFKRAKNKTRRNADIKSFKSVRVWDRILL
jgi:hypothetical protein